MHRVAEADEPVVPHPPEMLAHVVRLHMKIGGKDAEVAKFVKEVRVRTHTSFLPSAKNLSKATILHSQRKPQEEDVC